MKIGRNQPCPCGSGRKYKHCHYAIDSQIQQAERNEPQFLGTYLDFHQIYGPEENTRQHLINELEKFNIDDSLQVLAKLNYLLISKYGLGHQEDLQLLKDFMDSSSHSIVTSLYQRKKVHKVISHHQVLGLMMENFLLPENKSSVAVASDLRSFGKTLFRITPYLEGDVIDNTPGRSAPDIEVTMGSLFRNMFLNDTPVFDNLMGRYYSIFFKHLPAELKDPKLKNERYDFVKKFHEATGVELKLYICMGFLFWGHYEKGSFQDKLDFLKDPIKFVVNNSLPKIKKAYLARARKALDLLAAERATFKFDLEKNSIQRNGAVNYYRIEALLKHPVYKLPNGAYFPLDIDFLQRKITMGVKWAIHDALLEKEKSAGVDAAKEKFRRERNLLMAFYGRTIEAYVFALLNRIIKKQPGATLLYDKYGKMNLGADFIIYDPAEADSLIVIELTSSWMHYHKAMTGDLKAILTQFRNLFVRRDAGTDTAIEENFGNKSSKEKVQQLDSAINLAVAGKIEELKIHVPKIKHIYPVLLTEVGFPQFHPLTERYRKLISDAGLLVGSIQNFQLIDIEELELVEPILNKDYRLAQLFRGRLSSPESEYPLKNYLWEKDLGLAQCPEMAKQYRDIVKDGDSYLMTDFKSRISVWIFDVKQKLKDWGIIK